MSSYDEMKRDAGRVGIFGFKAICVLVFGGLAWAIVDAALSNVHLDGEWVGFALLWVLAPAAVIVYVLHSLRKHRP
jgi:hypothetical protein